MISKVIEIFKIFRANQKQSIHKKKDKKCWILAITMSPVLKATTMNIMLKHRLGFSDMIKYLVTALHTAVCT